MDELIGRLSSAAGVDAATASKALGHILAFLRAEAPQDAVAKLIAAIPGAEEAIAEAGSSGGGGGLLGGLGGLMGGGGIMALGGKLMGAGLPMGQIQPFSKELFAFGKEKAGEDVMGEIVASVPGLSQFV